MYRSKASHHLITSSGAAERCQASRHFRQLEWNLVSWLHRRTWRVN
jgi:hypothetical protein